MQNKFYCVEQRISKKKKNMFQKFHRMKNRTVQKVSVSIEKQSSGAICFPRYNKKPKATLGDCGNMKDTV